MTPVNQSNIPYQVVSCSAYSPGERRRRRGLFKEIIFVFPNQHYVWWRSASLGMAEHTCLPMRSGELMLWVLLLEHMAFALLIKLSSYQPRCLLFCTSSSVFHPMRDEWVTVCVGLRCQLGLNHDKLSETWHFRDIVNHFTPFEDGYLNTSYESDRNYCSF